MSTSTQTASSPALRWAVIAAIAGIAFFASYRYAVAASSTPQAAAGVSGTTAVASAGSGCCGGGATAGVTGTGAIAGATTGAGGCCGGSAARGPATTKAATVQAGVQKISVDLSKGYYDPSAIQLKAGVPAEITFGQSRGCTGIVQSQQLGFSEDLSSGPKTVKIAALQPGTYQFACGMGMVTGSVVVK
jgi:plastocyanin